MNINSHNNIKVFRIVHAAGWNTGKMQIMNRGRRGFTLVEIMIVVAIIGLLAAIAIPNFVRSRTTTQINQCIDNLRMIDAAQQQWALEVGASGSTVPAASNLQPYLGRGSGELPYCPIDPSLSFTTSYNLNNCSTPPTCKIAPALHVMP